MMGPPTGVETGPPPVGPPPLARGPVRRDPAPYRRRQLTVVVVLVLAVLAIIVLANLLGGDDTEGAPVTVPSVVGLDVNDAVAEIIEAGLDPRTSTKDDLVGERDTVVEQDPIGGIVAKKGDRVNLYLPAGSSETSITTAPTTEPDTTDVPDTTRATTPTTNAPATTAATVPPTAPPTVITLPPTTTVVVATTLAEEPPSP